MSTFNDPKKTTQVDMHRADIVAALRKKGWSLRELSRQNGLSAGTLKAALDRPYRKAEGIIAAAIEMTPETIWPERYAKRNFTPVLSLSSNLSTPAQLPHMAAAMG